MIQNKIKVLHIIKSLGRGGAETLLPETLKLHDKTQFEFHYIYFLPWKNQMVEDLKALGANISCIKASNNISLLLTYPKVIAYCRDNQIDVIHSHLPWSGFLSRIIFYKTKIPVLYTEHNIQERYHVLTKILNAYSFNFQNKALGVSDDVTRSIHKNINPKIEVETLLNGVNTEKFRRDFKKRLKLRNRLNIDENTIVIGNISVFRLQKDLESWIRAFKIISKSYSNVKGLLVGAGPEEGRIKNLIHTLNLNDKIILPGLQTDTVSYFSAMDIFMMSSAFEGLPIALLEAMSMKCAIVSTRAGGVVEVIRNGKDGLLVDVKDQDGLAEEVIGLIRDPIELKKLQEAARARVIDNFSLKKMVLNLEKEYLSLN